MVWPLFRVLSLHRTVQWYSTVPSGARLFLWFSVWPGALPVVHTIQSGAPPPDRPVCTSRAGLLAIQPVFSRVFGHLFRCVVPPLCVGDHCPAQVREERWGFFELQFRVESFNRLLFTPPSRSPSLVQQLISEPGTGSLYFYRFCDPLERP